MPSGRNGRLPQQKVGRKLSVRFDPDLAHEILDRVAQGELVGQICTTPGMPAPDTWWRWCNNYPEVMRLYKRAREVSAYALEEEAIGKGRDLTVGKKTAQQIRAGDVLMNQLRWSATKRNPEEFGQQRDGALVVPIHIETNLALPGGNGPTPEQIYNLEGIRTMDQIEEAPAMPAPEDVQEVLEHAELDVIARPPRKSRWDGMTPEEKQKERSRMAVKAREQRKRRLEQQNGGQPEHTGAEGEAPTDPPDE